MLRNRNFQPYHVDKHLKYQINQKVFFYCFLWFKKTVEVLKVYLRISTAHFEVDAICLFYLKDRVILSAAIEKVILDKKCSCTKCLC